MNYGIFAQVNEAGDNASDSTLSTEEFLDIEISKEDYEEKKAIEDKKINLLSLAIENMDSLTLAIEDVNSYDALVIAKEKVRTITANLYGVDNNFNTTLDGVVLSQEDIEGSLTNLTDVVDNVSAVALEGLMDNIKNMGTGIVDSVSSWFGKDLKFFRAVSEEFKSGKRIMRTELHGNPDYINKKLAIYYATTGKDLNVKDFMAHLKRPYELVVKNNMLGKAEDYLSGAYVITKEQLMKGKFVECKECVKDLKDALPKELHSELLKDITFGYSLDSVGDSLNIVQCGPDTVLGFKYLRAKYDTAYIPEKYYIDRDIEIFKKSDMEELVKYHREDFSVNYDAIKKSTKLDGMVAELKQQAREILTALANKDLIGVALRLNTRTRIATQTLNFVMYVRYSVNNIVSDQKRSVALTKRLIKSMSKTV